MDTIESQTFYEPEISDQSGNWIPAWFTGVHDPAYGNGDLLVRVRSFVRGGLSCFLLFLTFSFSGVL